MKVFGRLMIHPINLRFVVYESGNFEGQLKVTSDLDFYDTVIVTLESPDLVEMVYYAYV